MAQRDVRAMHRAYVPAMKIQPARCGVGTMLDEGEARHRIHIDLRRISTENYSKVPIIRNLESLVPGSSNRFPVAIKEKEPLVALE